MTSTALDRMDQDAIESSPPTPRVLSEDVDPELLPCRTHDPELWFAEAPSRVQVAKDLCQGCPVRQLCLAGALDRREPWGVWGGEQFQQGVVVAHKRGRGRPRKDELAARRDQPPAASASTLAVAAQSADPRATASTR